MTLAFPATIEMLGDHSWSHSEKYTLSVTPVSGPGARPSSFVWRNERFGECETKTAFLMPGWRYEVRLDHSGTKPGLPTDYDYTLLQTGTPPSNVIITDDQSLFGVDETSTSFTGAGKVAYLYVLAPPEISAPAVVGVNRDDDDGNGVADWGDTRAGSSEDDLVEVKVKVVEPAGVQGTVTVTPYMLPLSGTLWKDREKVDSVDTSDVLAIPPSGSVEQTYYLEGSVNSSVYRSERLEVKVVCGSVTLTTNHVFTVVGAQIRNVLSNTGGIEVYFIPGNGSDLENLGSHTLYGIIIRSSANARTLAHEIGHACGWADIYIREGRNGPIPEELNNRVRRDWMPDDWSGGGNVGGFYETVLRQDELIPRLLMYGVENDVQADIPAGAVYGLPKVGGLGNVNVGWGGFFTPSPRSL